MAHKKQVDLKFFASGYCTVHKKILNISNDKGTYKSYSTWCLIRHSAYGIILFDTGYSTRFFSATKSYPDRFHALATPVFINEAGSAKALLLNEGILPSEVRYIIISHFHADHVCGLIDFPNAQFICSSAALAQMKALNGFNAVKKGILKKLIPGDLIPRTLFIEDISSANFDTASKLTFFKLFGLEELQVVYLPGHARGMLGLFVTTGSQKVLFATDAAWDSEAFRKKILPKKIVKFFFDSWTDYRETYEKLYSFMDNNADVELLFTHCPLTLKRTENAV